MEMSSNCYLSYFQKKTFLDNYRLLIKNYRLNDISTKLQLEKMMLYFLICAKIIVCNLLFHLLNYVIFSSKTFLLIQSIRFLINLMFKNNTFL